MSANVTTTGFTIRMYLSAPTSHRRVSLQLTSASFIGQLGVKHLCHQLPGTTTLHWPGVGVLFFQRGFRRTLLASATYMTCKHCLRQKQESGKRKILFVWSSWGSQTPLHSTRGPSWLHGWKWTHTDTQFRGYPQIIFLLWKYVINRLAMWEP